MTLFGFVDDVIELRWRYKLIIPCIATLPLAQAYWSQHQSTTIVFPSYSYTSPLIQASWGRFWALRKKTSPSWAKSFPSSPRSAASPTAQRSISVEQRIGFHLDGWYYIYIVMLCIFCTNSINIYAGINGLEVGQSIVIACSLLFINIVDIIIGGDADYVQNHVFSATMVLPSSRRPSLCSTSIAILRRCSSGIRLPIRRALRLRQWGFLGILASRCFCFSFRNL